MLQPAACRALGGAALRSSAASRRCLGTAPAQPGRGDSSERPRDQAGDLEASGTVVQAPSATALPDPAAPNAQIPFLQRLSEAAQDMLLRPLAGTRGHAYHYAEDSARAALRDEERGSGPDLTSMYAPVEEVGDNITAPKGWHFSNRIDQLEEKQQERVAAQVDRAREAGGPPAEK